MNHRMKNIRNIIILTAMFAIAMFSCKKDKDVAVTSVTITAPAGDATLTVGGATLTLTATVLPDNAADKSLTWTSDNTGVVAVGEKTGTVTAVAPGSCKIIATATNGKSGNITVTVKAAFVAVTGITGVPTIAVARTPLTLAGTVAPATATNQTIVWSIFNAGATGATIADGNTLNTTGEGTVKIRATIVNGLSASTDFVQEFDITVNHPFASGAGASGNPYRVANDEQLNAVRYYPTAYFVQTANIFLSGIWTPIGTTYAIRFTGVYDGGGYSISNLNIPSATAEYQGLFGYIGEGGVVKNVALRNVNISSANDYAGGITGYNVGTIENCYVTGTVSGGSLVGGIAGMTYHGVIKNCYTTCNVTGSAWDAGGISGLNNGGTVQYCYATGTVTGTEMVGGIVGDNFRQTSAATIVDHCVALNNEVAATEATGAVGRVVGINNSGTLASNYSRPAGNMTLKNGSGNVTPTSDVSGKDGVNASEFYWNGAGSGGVFWTSSCGFSATFWDRENGRLPWLKTTGGAAFNQSQSPEMLTNAQTPTITENPVGAIYVLNQTAVPNKVSATVTDGGALSYQWYSNATNSNTGGTAIGGATSTSYSPSTAAAGVRYIYAVVTNTNNNVNGSKTAAKASEPARIEVVAP